jgi:hypothetical protein
MQIKTKRINIPIFFSWDYKQILCENAGNAGNKQERTLLRIEGIPENFYKNLIFKFI